MPRKPNRQATRMTPGFNAPPTERKKARAPRTVDAFGETGWQRDPIVQQGTLFDVRAVDHLPGNADATRQRVGPRGYSKGRLDEVRQGLNDSHTEINYDVKEPEHWQAGDSDVREGGDDKKRVSAVNSHQHIYAPPQNLDSEKRPQQFMQDRLGERGRAHLEQTLARSTVPVEHLRGLREISVKEPSPEGFGGTYWGGGTGSGSINLHARKTSGYAGDMPAKTAADQELTFLHELGHHESHISQSDSSQYNTPQRRGIEESRADTYALTHFRIDPRMKKRETSSYSSFGFDPRDHSYQARGQEHYDGQTGYKLNPNLTPRQHDKPSPGHRTAEDQQRAQPMLDETGGPDVFTHEAAPLSWSTDKRTEVELQSGEKTSTWQRAYEPRPLKGTTRDEQGELTTLKDPGLREIRHRDMVYSQAATHHNVRVSDAAHAAHNDEIEARYGTGRRKRR